MATGKVYKTVGEINALLNAIENAPNIYTTPAQVEAQVEEGVALLPKKDGSYPQMSVGFAEHLVGDGTATEEEFSFRPTAGADRNVETTAYDYDMRSNFAARIEAVKGNSVVWNSCIANGDFKGGVAGEFAEGWKNGTYLISTRADITYPAEGGILLTAKEGVSGNGMLQSSVFQSGQIKAGEKVLISLIYRSTCIFAVGGVNGGNYRISLPISASNKQYAAIKEFSVTLQNFAIQMLTSYDAGDTIYVNNLRVINLTQMFGAGNEPTTVEEFYARLPKGVDLNAYNEGEIVDANYGAIKTTGFNQYNGTYAKVLGGYAYYLGGTYTSVGFTTEEGGTTEAITIPSNKLYTPSQNGYIYAEGSDICINLAWNEYASLNGTYKPYKPFERDLSWVAQYFPEGMRRAGDISDEIRFNSTSQKWEAVQNVEVRAYTSGDESDTTLTTDGTNTNYPLATPIVTEIEETPNLDYDVADYGTEELVVADGVKSAPFLGNIIYTPNALKTLEQVPDILRRLAALENA